MFELTLTNLPRVPVRNIPHFLVDPALPALYPLVMAYRPSRRWTLLAVLAALLLISSAGCRAPGPNSDPPGGGACSGLASSPGLSWQSHSTLTVGALEVAFELEARARARILPAPTEP